MVTVKTIRIAHLAIVVEDIQTALDFWRDAVGLEMAELRDVPAEAARVAFLPVGDSEIELVQPTTQDSGMAKFLAKRGAGMHHVCLEVDDIEAAMEQLKARGVRLIHEAPLTGADGRRYAFIHPQSATGVLVELYETVK
ncbi:MAG: methylmalonyl-CoA epimerase [Anaerolineales bacterium]|nr:methylmalonyl-CoA epimerase [Anaerolineales bacterium]